MLARMVHRGPDGEGTYFDQTVSLGMRRLAVIDVADGIQPYRSEDGRVVAVFNGELYNYPELARVVTSRGHRLNSRTDGEVLVHLYELYSSDLVAHLRGMFAFAIWDSRHQRLLLARDHVGQKPLYILEDDQGIAFSSELKAFYGLAGWRPKIDPELLATYLAHRYVPAPFTMMRGVSKLQPGEAMMLYANGRRQRWFYWQPPLAEPQAWREPEAATADLDVLLGETVRDHLTADVPVGVFLSGGLDSSLITAMAAQVRGGSHLRAWTAAFPGEYAGYDESEWAAEIAGRLRMPLERVEVDSGISPERLKELAYILDEPMADPTVLPLDGLARAVRGQAVVILSGEGADETFAGYAGYGEPASLRQLQRIPAGLRRIWLASGLPGKGALERSFSPISDRYRGVGFTFDRASQEHILRPEWHRADRLETMIHYWDRMQAISPLQAMQGFDVKWFLADDVLLKMDRIGMHHHLEVRAPFCDYRIVEWALRSPLTFRRNGNRDKWILRQVAERHLPKALVRRPKRGFPTPLTALLAGPLHQMAWDVLSHPRALIYDWLEPTAVRALLAASNVPSPPSYLARQIYALVMFEFWLQNVREQSTLKLRREEHQ